MIRHRVFARFRSDVSPAERTAIHADLEALRQVIEGMETVQFSANVSPEPFARGFSHGFTIDFRDAAARDAYLVHERISVPAPGWSRPSKAAPTD
ncbi:Dabb family protein [Mesorhizobium sp. Cs1321R2N1]|uniref:Dabb family protein n=1 Tax=Mesorhizobium sp. Cs1321R2N1 TaxID=3015174 RepID=UPI0030A16CF7